MTVAPNVDSFKILQRQTWASLKEGSHAVLMQLVSSATNESSQSCSWEKIDFCGLFHLIISFGSAARTGGFLHVQLFRTSNNFQKLSITFLNCLLRLKLVDSPTAHEEVKSRTLTDRTSRVPGEGPLRAASDVRVWIQFHRKLTEVEHTPV